MYRRFCILLSAIIIAAGCARSAVDNPVQPSGNSSLSPPVKSALHRDPRHLLGLWHVEIPLDTLQAEIVPVRSADMHLNVTRLLEVTPCTDCLRIEDVHVTNGEVLSARIWIKHPYAPTKKYCAFDTRGIFISGSDTYFPVGNRFVAMSGKKPQLIDPDGYTTLFNPSEFPPTPGVPPALRYIPGLHAEGDDLAATLNPFLAFSKDAERRLFGAGYPWTMRVYAISIPEGAKKIDFGYAVDACWMDVDKVSNPWLDFPPEANCLEAYETRISFKDGLLPVAGAQVETNVDVLDHQGLDTISSVTCEAPQLFSGEVILKYSETLADGAFRFVGNITNELGVNVGNYPMLVRVRDTQSDPNLGEIDAWNAGEVAVEQSWVNTWGGTGADAGNAVAVDHNSNIYVVGQFSGTVDFDPGSGTNNQWAEAGAFLVKYDPGGNFVWVSAWGGDPDASAVASGICINNIGEIYVTGEFSGTVDFDPGPKSCVRTGKNTAYLIQYDSNGLFQWVRTWGGDGFNSGIDVSPSPDGTLLVTGVYSGSADFDPGTGVDLHTSYGGQDIFLAKYNSSGMFQWAKTWGGEGKDDFGDGVAVDQSNNIYVSGAFQDTVDLNPGPGSYVRTSNGGLDCFLSQFNSDGGFLWSDYWGGMDNDACHDVGALCPGTVAVCGEFRGAVDMDPGSGEDVHDPPGTLSSFTSVFTSGGNLMKCVAWGGSPATPGCEPATSLAVDSAGNLYLTGFFAGQVDFDPEGGGDIHASVSNSWDCFVDKFDSSGKHLWTQTWGGTADDRGLGIALAKNGGIYAVGFFNGTVDFNPGPDVENRKSTGGTDAFLVRYSPSGNW